jgi:hypothetical protein
MTAATLAAHERPKVVFDHLVRMTDARGLFEHAEFATPRPGHGYCVDDVARGLVVVSREPGQGELVRRLTRRYLNFVLAALAADGTCRNRMSVAGEWLDEPSVGDWWGRAVWGLGVSAASAPTRSLRARSLAGFRIVAQQRSPHNRAMAFAAIGAGRVLSAWPDEVPARDLLADCAAALMHPAAEPGYPGWPWIEPRLRYANAAVAEALITAGSLLGQQPTLQRGLELLAFLLDAQTAANGHLSVVSVDGRGPRDIGASFDQQPIEVAALAEACAAAYVATVDPRWSGEVSRAWRWFLGANDSDTPMVDIETGGGYDGLQRDGRNLNQGAESTLAALATAQCARLVHDRG